MTFDITKDPESGITTWNIRFGGRTLGARITGPLIVNLTVSPEVPTEKIHDFIATSVRTRVEKIDELNVIESPCRLRTEHQIRLEVVRMTHAIIDPADGSLSLLHHFATAFRRDGDDKAADLTDALANTWRDATKAAEALAEIEKLTGWISLDDEFEEVENDKQRARAERV
jgi:hypothetical protein